MNKLFWIIVSVLGFLAAFFVLYDSVNSIQKNENMGGAVSQEDDSFERVLNNLKKNKKDTYLVASKNIYELKPWAKDHLTLDMLKAMPDNSFNDVSNQDPDEFIGAKVCVKGHVYYHRNYKEPNDTSPDVYEGSIEFPAKYNNIRDDYINFISVKNNSELSGSHEWLTDITGQRKTVKFCGIMAGIETKSSTISNGFSAAPLLIGMFVP